MQNIMIQNNENIVLQKAGLYIGLAKQKGYQVIQYDPSGHQNPPIFSIDCGLTCRHDINEKRRTCEECGQNLQLYRDRVMEIFKTRVRIDLISNKYCVVPSTKKQWISLPSNTMPQMSHLQYSKALRAAGQDTETREYISNYYNYQILPIPSVRSYWQEYGYVQSGQCLSLVREGEHVRVILGKDTMYGIRVEQKYGCIRQCSYCCGYLAVVCLGKNRATLLVYELGEWECQPSYSITIGKFQQQKQAHSQYSLMFNYQCLHILCSDMLTGSAKVIQVSNVMTQSPDIQIVSQTQFSTPPQQTLLNHSHGTFYFQTSVHGQCQMGALYIDSQHITLEHKEQKITIGNQHNIVKVDGVIHVIGKSKVYFYSISPSSSINLIKYEHLLGRLSSELVQYQNFVKQPLDILDLPLDLPILYSKPAIDGCILTCHALHDNQIHLFKVCIAL